MFAITESEIYFAAMIYMRVTLCHKIKLLKGNTMFTLYFSDFFYSKSYIE